MLKTKKLISFVTVLAMLFTLFTTVGFAAELENSTISEDEAGTMALIFVANSIKSSADTNWDKDTRIKRIVPLYGEGDATTAYCFELAKNGQDNGYVTVSASDDMNLIQEFSDSAKPVYSGLTKDESKKVYFTSALEYFVKDSNVRGNNNFTDMRGIKVEASKVKNKFKKDKKVSSENKPIRQVIQKKGKLNLNDWMLGGSPGNPYGGISDAYAYVNDAYGSGWTANYYNSLESKITKHLTSEFPDDNNCSLIALSTIFQYWKNYGGCTALPSSFSTIYSDIKTIASTNYFTTADGLFKTYWYTPQDGTRPDYIDDIVTLMFKKYGYTNGRGNNDYLLQWSVAKAEIDQGRPFCFNLANNPYPNHTITVYAYSAFKKSGSSDVCFLKVADGWTTDSRYIDWNQFIGFGSFTKVFPN